MTITEPGRGIRSVASTVKQADQAIVVATRSFEPQSSLNPWGPKVDRHEEVIEIGAEALTALREGRATIEIRAEGAGTLFRAAPVTVATEERPVLLRPPLLFDRTSTTFVAQGGAEAVVYDVGPTAARHGVRVGDRTFEGQRHDALGENGAFALFGVPHDVAGAEDIRLFAEDLASNRAEVPFVDQFKEKPFREDQITINDRIMKAVVPPILAATPKLEDKGSLLENYLQINGPLRRALNDRLVELGQESRKEFLWTQPFLQMNAQVVSAFADRRTYLYEGKVVDSQDHLGFDLAP
ncbi:MAG: hypothetical protein HC923_13440 [Myxococcales bacterium]|nr:hypothetical protein [Myxococcales bacterium]